MLDSDHIGDLLRVVIETTQVSTRGPTVGMFERALEKKLGVKHAICTSSGTAALQVALKALGVGPGTDVIVPALSFIATANAVSLLGADPVFVDSGNLLEGDFTLGISVSSIQEVLAAYEKTSRGPVNKNTGRTLAAVVPMHTLGRLCNMTPIRRLCNEWGIPVVEDAAEAIGSKDSQGLHPGSSGIATLSFNGNKTITTGGGGAVLTDSDRLAERIRHLSSVAKKIHPWKFEHDEIGWNYRMPAVNAALGVSQIDNLELIISSKARLHAAYETQFSDSPFFSVVPNPLNQTPNNWLVAVSLSEEHKKHLNGVLDAVITLGVECRPMWDLLPLLKPYINADRSSVSNAAAIRETLICLPSSPILGNSL